MLVCHHALHQLVPHPELGTGASTIHQSWCLLSETQAPDTACLQRQGDDGQAQAEQLPSLEQLLSKRDFLGAATLLQVTQSKSKDPQQQLWLAYCLFHAGRYAKATEIYDSLLTQPDADGELHAYAAACHFYLGNYTEAEARAQQAPPCPLVNRILLHCAHAQGDEEKLVERHNLMSKDHLDDQLSLAAIHFRRSHFQVRLAQSL